MDKQHNKRIYLMSCIAAIAGLLFGFDTGVISGAILFINQAFHLSHLQTEIVISSVLLGAVLGASLSGRLCDIIGRKKIILITSLIFCIGTLICACAMTVSHLITGRVILGTAIGIASFTAPLYLAELAPKNKRGYLVSLNQLAITAGILLSYVVDYYFTASGGWRWMLLFGLAPSVLLLIGALLLPESPRFLMLKGRIKEAKAILQTLRPSHEVDTEMEAILSCNSPHTTYWQEIFNNRHVRNIVMVGCLLAIIQQITGINTIIYYAPTIFKLAGFQTDSAVLMTAIVGLANFLFTIIALPLIDKLGRRKLLIMGLTGMLMSLMMIGFAFHQTELSSSLRYLTVISMILYIACFAVGLGPITFVLLSEIFPLKIRGLAMSMSLAANWLSNLVVALTFLTLIDVVGTGDTFYLYALINIFSLFFVFSFIPETKGCSLEHIEKRLYAGCPPRELGQEDPLEPAVYEGERHVVRK